MVEVVIYALILGFCLGALVMIAVYDYFEGWHDENTR